MRFKLANDRLRVLMGEVHDIFVAGILYHKKLLFFLFVTNQKKAIQSRRN